jgi:FkbM family methyltransferase
MPVHRRRPVPLPDRGAAAPLQVCAAKIASALNVFRVYLRQIPRLGLTAATMLFLAEASERKPISRLVAPIAPVFLKIKPAGYQFPLTVRRADSDRIVIRQILAREEYGPVSALPDIRLIVDCGANIGVSSYYFLHRYPAARLIAIEPDAQNCALCRQNLRPFGDRVVVMQAALWPERRALRITPSSRRLGSWGLRVEPVAVEESALAEVDGLTIPDILARAHEQGPIDLIKIDVEGAETELFRTSPAWLASIRNIAIELHGDAARAAFAAALSGYVYTWEDVHESTIVRSLRARGEA